MIAKIAFLISTNLLLSVFVYYGVIWLKLYVETKRVDKLIAKCESEIKRRNQSITDE